jgi:AcrR family transcriptional regulator
MAIYTHFGGMEELRREVRREGFARLRDHLAAVPETSDPLADLALLGWAYYSTASENPNLYRAMFLDGPLDDDDLTTGADTFGQLVAGVTRCIQAGHFCDADPVELATQLWASSHGLISLQFANLLSPEQTQAHLIEIGRRLIIGYEADSRSGSSR